MASGARHVIFNAISIVCLLAGCHGGDDPDGGDTVATDSTPTVTVPPQPITPGGRLVPGEILSKPLRPAVMQSDAGRFTLLPPEQTGLHFVNPIDTNHPLKRLYHSGAACGGVAIGDVDGDGWPDVFLTSGPRGNKLFRQVEAFVFEDITATAGVAADGAWCSGAAMVDIEGDGDLDIYVCCYDSPNRLYINDGHGKFTEGAKAAGLDIVDASLTATFCDYDGDGHLDVFVLTNRYYREGGRPQQPPIGSRNGRPYILPEYEKYFALMQVGPQRYIANITGRADRLLRNRGDGTFEDVTKQAGIDGAHHGLSAIWFDYDDDARPDLYVANDFNDPDRLYHNNGDGTFTDVIERTMPHTTGVSMGSDFGDVNNDGHLDLLVADMSATTHFKQKIMMGDMSDNRWLMETLRPPQMMRNALLINTGTGRFMEAAYLAGLAKTDWTWSVKLADLDNDGRVDAFFTNGAARNFNHSDHAPQQQQLLGHTVFELYEDQPPLRERNLAFRNLGDLRFENVGKSWGLDHLGMSYAAAHGDLDGDGDLDLVVCNLDEPVSVYRNDVAQGHRIVVRLVGAGANTYGIGATVRIEAGGQTQVRQLTPVTGFLASNQPLVHFGLGSHKTIDRLSVRWPFGALQTFESLSADREYTISQDEASPSPPTVDAPPETIYRASDLLQLVAHRETRYDDFRRQPLLPSKLSQLGPPMAWGDVDGDGDDDLYVGAAAGDSAGIVFNENGQRFRLGNLHPFNQHAGHEDMGALFFDADSDGDADLYVVSGGVECEPGANTLRDRLYLNDGRGEFTTAPEGALPDLRDSGGVVAACDFDRDGDLDLFVGGRSVPGRYPLAPASRLLVNDGGKFSDATQRLAPGLLKTGMVTGALWSDADGDGWPDLLLTHEWGPVKLFHNEGGRLVDRTQAAALGNRLGWWNGIAGGDVDNDGDLDYVVTNFGLNTKYHATLQRPALLYYGDFDRNGRMRIVEAEYENQTLFPVRGKSCSTAAMPHLENRFSTFENFALADLAAIYTPKCLDESLKLVANTLESGVLLNDGSGRFTFRPLPRLAQIAPAFGVVLIDMDSDGALDVCLAQNFYGPQPETGRMDGGLGLLLKGHGNGDFSPIWPRRSGLVVPGDAKSLTWSDLNGDGWPDLVIAVNDGPVRAFLHAGRDEVRPLTVRLEGDRGNPTAVGARVTLVFDGRTMRTAEVYAGGGYLSQSPPHLVFGLSKDRHPQRIDVVWPDGTTSQSSVERDRRQIVIKKSRAAE